MMDTTSRTSTGYGFEASPSISAQTAAQSSQSFGTSKGSRLLRSWMSMGDFLGSMRGTWSKGGPTQARHDNLSRTSIEEYTVNRDADDDEALTREALQNKDQACHNSSGPS